MTTKVKTKAPKMSQALARVRRAGVEAPEPELLRWIASVNPETILSSSLSDIREVAGAF